MDFLFFYQKKKNERERERERDIINTRVIPESLSSSTTVISLSVLPSERTLIANWKCKTAYKW